MRQQLTSLGMALKLIRRPTQFLNDRAREGCRDQFLRRALGTAERSH